MVQFVILVGMHCVSNVLHLWLWPSEKLLLEKGFINQCKDWFEKRCKNNFSFIAMFIFFCLRFRGERRVFIQKREGQEEKCGSRVRIWWRHQRGIFVFSSPGQISCNNVRFVRWWWWTSIPFQHVRVWDRFR